MQTLELKDDPRYITEWERENLKLLNRVIGERNDLEKKYVDLQNNFEKLLHFTWNTLE